LEPLGQPVSSIGNTSFPVGVSSSPTKHGDVATSGGERYLPEEAVRVAEVSEVSPLSGRCFLHDAATGRQGVCQNLVHSIARRDDEVEGDSPESGSLGRNPSILRRRLPLVERQRTRIPQSDAFDLGHAAFTRLETKRLGSVLLGNPVTVFDVSYPRHVLLDTIVIAIRPPATREHGL
jgi:hypothetical protein